MLLKLRAPPHTPLCGPLTPSLPLPCPAVCYASQQQLVNLALYRRKVARASLSRRSLSVETAERALLEESDIEGMSHFLDSLKWDASGLVAVVVQVGFNSPSSLTMGC